MLTKIWMIERNQHVPFVKKRTGPKSSTYFNLSERKKSIFFLVYKPSKKYNRMFLSSRDINQFLLKPRWENIRLSRHQNYRIIRKWTFLWQFLSKIFLKRFRNQRKNHNAFKCALPIRRKETWSQFSAQFFQSSWKKIISKHTCRLSLISQSSTKRPLASLRNTFSEDGDKIVYGFGMAERKLMSLKQCLETSRPQTSKRNYCNCIEKQKRFKHVPYVIWLQAWERLNA